MKVTSFPNCANPDCLACHVDSTHSKLVSKSALTWLAGTLCLLTLLVIGCGVDIRQVRTPTPVTIKERTRAFAKTIVELELQRDIVVQDYQVLNRNMLDMSTREVFEKADSLVQRQRDLYGKLVLVNTSDSALRATHNAFESAYVAELRAYEALALAVRAGDPSKMLTASLDLLRADDLYRDAYNKLESQLATVGLALTDVR